MNREHEYLNLKLYILLKLSSLCSRKIGAVSASNLDFVISLTARFWSIVSLLKFISYVQPHLIFP